MPMHARDVSEDDPEWEQDREPPWEKTSDVSDRVLRDRSKLRRPELLLNPVTMMARFRATASADVWPGFASLADVEYAACAASVELEPCRLTMMLSPRTEDWDTRRPVASCHRDRGPKTIRGGTTGAAAEPPPP